MAKNTFVFHYNVHDDNVSEDDPEVKLEIYADDLEDAANEAAETVAADDWDYEPWSSRSSEYAKDVSILHAPTGQKWKFKVSVEFDPVFSARKYRPCNMCDESGRDKNNPQYRCSRCGGTKMWA